jgi:RimJ/RimL family protein N-acetyltransferase
MQNLWDTCPENSQGLHFSPLKRTDFKALYEIASDPLIWELHPDRLRYTERGFQAFFEKALLDDCCSYILSDMTNGRTIGSSRYYAYNVVEASVFIGYTFLSREYWGGIWNSRLKLAMLTTAFRFCKIVYFEAGPANLRSIAALEKLGARRMPDNESEKIRFRVDSENWPFIKQNLEKKLAIPQ